MGFLVKNRVLGVPAAPERTGYDDGVMRELLGLKDDGISSNKLKEITYFTCLKIRMESLAKLPFKVYNDSDKKLKYLLGKRPNPYMSAFDFWKLVQFNIDHKGNSINAINWDRKTGEIVSIIPLDVEKITILIDNVNLFSKSDENKIYYKYKPTPSEEIIFKASEILHFKGFSLDGFTGIPILDYVKDQVEVGQSGQQFIKKHFSDGLLGRLILQYTGDVKPENRNALINQFTQMNGGVKNAGKIIPMPIGYNLTSIDNKMADSQFFELRNMSSLQLAAAMGIKPQMLNILEKSSYASIEALNDAYYKETLLSILTPVEQEIDYKIPNTKQKADGWYCKFNVDVLLRPTLEKRAAIYQSAVYTGWMKHNEIRRYEDLPEDKNGNELMVNASLMPLKEALKEKGGEDDK